VAEARDEPVKSHGPRATSAGDEAGLVQRCAAGDGDAFRELVNRHAGLAFNVARRMLREDAEAEDVAQEALLRLWRNSAKLEVGLDGVKPWLRRVVSNLAIDRLRRAQAEVVTDEVPDAGEPASQLTRLERRDTAMRVREAIDRLPDRQRMALALFHFEGLSQIEVGRQLGISDEAVESLLARARRALKAELREEYLDLSRGTGK
jgi:RNA polymerase sigma-70 factor, ECF subfamily